MAETYVICPYDKYHKILTTKVTSHLDKCRQNYREKQAATGVKARKLTCKYNYLHEFYAPELLFHEAGCQDGAQRLPVAFLNHMLDHALQTQQAKEIEAVEKIFEEQTKLWRLRIYDRPLVPSNYLRVAIPARNTKDELRYPGLYKKLLENAKKKKDEGAKDKDLSSVGAASIPAQNAERKKSKDKSATAGTSKSQADSKNPERTSESTDDEDWGKTANSPKFDYMKHRMNPRKPMLNSYPPGLTKAQRRQYDKYNKEWLQKIEAESFESEEPKEPKK